MPESVTTALIGAAVALVGAFIAQFIAEKYRRHLDANALASGIVGELSAYDGSAGRLREAVHSWKEAVQTGRRSDLVLRPFDKPVDLFFDASVAKIGLLGAPLVQHVVYIYANLRAFRLALDILSRHYKDMTDGEFLQRCDLCLERLNAAENRGKFAIPYLQKRTDLKFHQALGDVPAP